MSKSVCKSRYPGDRVLLNLAEWSFH